MFQQGLNAGNHNRIFMGEGKVINDVKKKSLASLFASILSFIYTYENAHKTTGVYTALYMKLRRS